MSEKNTRDDYFLDDDDFVGEINESIEDYFLDIDEDKRDDIDDEIESRIENSKIENISEEGIDVEDSSLGGITVEDNKTEDIQTDNINIEDINMEEIIEGIGQKEQEIAEEEFGKSFQTAGGATMNTGKRKTPVSSKTNSNPAKGGPHRSASGRPKGNRSGTGHANGSRGNSNGKRPNGNSVNGNGNRSHRNSTKTTSRSAPTNRSRNVSPSHRRRSQKKKTNMKAVGILTVSVLVLLFVGYVAVSIYFTNHFLFNTRINGQDFSRKTVAEAQAELIGQVDDYQLTIITLGGDVNVIRGADIGMRYEESAEIYELMREQSGFNWLSSLFNTINIEVDFPLTFSEVALEQAIQKLPVMTEEQIMPTSAHVVFDGTVFTIAPEVPGTAFDEERLVNAINYAIPAMQESIDMQALNLQIHPEVSSDSPDLAAKVTSLNRYLSAVITFDVGEQVVVDGSLIIQWMEIDDNYNVTLLEEPIYEWVTEFGNRHSTRESTRPVTTPRGRQSQVSGGTYGWWINHAGTTELLINQIRQGAVTTIEPVYFINGRAAEFSPNDWGSTFIQVDLTEQHMWYIVNGQVVFETPVITGLPGRSPTPEGVYYIIYMASPAVLRGPHDPETDTYEWESDVSYWMPITWGGIGFHDATWQTQGFGGDLYRTLGSRGCINMSLEAARELFGLISEFTPVVIHY